MSIVMPVHNAGRYLDASVDSILRQTFSDFELVMLDDGSTDGSLERLRRYEATDPRIRVVESVDRLGPAASSTLVVECSTAPLVARMDADDVAYPDRLLCQIELLAERPDVVLVGSTSDTIDARGHRVRAADYGRLLRETWTPPFGHSSIMFRRSAFDEVGGYRLAASRWEDVDLCIRLAGVGPVLVIAEPLVRVRVSEASTRIADAPEAVEAAMDNMYRALSAASPRTDRLAPYSFVPAASIHVWGGRSPRVLPRLLRTGDLSLDTQTLRVLLWAMWADVSPRTLRAFLRTMLAVRNRRALRRLGGASVVEWRPPAAVNPIAAIT